MTAVVIIKDLAGHPLIQVGRYLDPSMDDGPWIDYGAVGETVTAEPYTRDGIHVSALGFECKTCRDRGTPHVFRADFPAIETTLARLLEKQREIGKPGTAYVSASPAPKG